MDKKNIKPKKKKVYSEKLPPARTREGRENQLIALAMDCLEERLKSGKATAQEILMLAREGLSSAKLDKDLKNHQVNLFDAKAENLKMDRMNQESLNEVLNLVKEYRGDDSQIDDVR